MNFYDIEITPFPINNDKTFEHFTRDIFNSIFNTISFHMYARNGQEQYGVDVISEEEKIAIQCKQVEVGGDRNKIKKDLLKKLDNDYSDFLELNKKHGKIFKKFIYASTFVSDNDIQDRCIALSTSGVTVEYWFWDRLTNNADENIRTNYFPYLMELNHKYFSEPIRIKIDKKRHSLDQFEEVFNQAYKYWNFIPTSKLSKLPPFLNDTDKGIPYFNTFNLVYNNTSLIDFFKSIEISDEGKVSIINKEYFKKVKKPIQKLNGIFKLLTNNLVFYYSHSGSNPTWNLRVTDNRQCSCYRCSFLRNDFERAFREFNKQKINGIDSKEDLKLAHTAYLMKNHKKSVEFLFEVIEKYPNNPPIKFVAHFNLLKLKSTIRRLSWDDKSLESIVKKIENIELSKSFKIIKTEIDKSVAEYIIQNDFYDNSLFKICELKAKIEKHYYSLLKGGWSSNNHIGELICRYGEYDSFISENYLCYDFFIEHRQIFEITLDALFCSYAIKQNGQPGLDYFDDWILGNIIQHSNRKDILHYFTKYKLNEIKYKKSDSSYSFLIVLENFFKTQLKQLVKNYNTSDDFTYLYDRYCQNFITISSFIYFPQVDVNHITTVLLDFIETRGYLYPYHDSFNTYFTNRKDISKKDVLRLITFLLKKEIDHSSNIIKNLSVKLRDYSVKVEIDQDLFKHTIAESDKRSDILPFIKLWCSDVQGISLQNKILELLSTSFNPDLYFFSSMWNAIDYHIYFDKYIEYCKSQNSRKKNSYLFSRDTLAYRTDLNNLIDLCFEYGINLKDKVFTKFLGINDYYDWLFDIDGFDYTLFDPKWITEYYLSKGYISNFRNEKVLNKVKAYLREYNDPVVVKALTSITVADI